MLRAWERGTRSSSTWWRLRPSTSISFPSWSTASWGHSEWPPAPRNHPLAMMMSVASSLTGVWVWFPIDTPLVLRLVKTHMGKCLFSPELKSYLITQWNCTTIGSCRCRKMNQWVGSGAARTYGDDTRQYSRRNGRGIWLYKRSFRQRILRFFLLQRRRLHLHWSREAYSPLTRLAVGPSDLDLLGWSAFNAPQHRSSSGPVRCRYPAIT